MRLFLFTTVLSIFTFFLNAQENNWDLQFNIPVNSNGKDLGAICDGNHFYFHNYNLNLVYKLELDGGFNTIFQISGYHPLGEITFDGSYFYQINMNTSEFYKMDFYSDPPAAVETIDLEFEAEGLSFITYDSTANNMVGGFWIGGGSNSIYLINREGETLREILPETHGLTDISGGAFDNFSDGGPYLWLSNHNPEENVTLTRLDIISGQPSGISKSLNGLLAETGDVGGGLFVQQGIVDSSYTLGGIIPGKLIYGFDLATTNAYNLDAEIHDINNLNYNENSSILSFSYNIKNHGLSNIDSLMVHFQADNGPVQSRNIVNSNLAQFDTLELIDSIFIEPIEGKNQLNLWFASINDSLDQNEFNDETLSTFYLYDIALVSNNMVKHNPDTTTVPMSFTIQSFGIQPVNNLQLYYQVDGGEVIQHDLSGLEIDQYDTYDIQYSLSPDLGKHQLDVWIDAPNGKLDQFQANNIYPFEYIVYNAEKAKARTPLLEVFSSSTCAPCVYGNKKLKEMQEASDGNWTCVKYQMNFPGAGDPYFTNEGYSRASYYQLTGVPELHVDGTTDIYPGSYTNQSLKLNQSIPSFIEIDAHYIQNEKEFDITVDLHPSDNIISTSLALYVAIIENKTYNNVGNNGETEFEFVMKKLLPGINGKSLPPLQQNVKKSYELNYTFKGDYRLPQNASNPINHSIEHSVEEFDDLSVVVWVQNKSTKEVLQSTWATNTTNTEGIVDDGSGIIALFPNPSSDFIYLHYLLKERKDCSWEIYDLDASLVQSMEMGPKSTGKHLERISIDSLVPGYYVMSLKIGQQTYQRKIIVGSK